MDVVEQPPHPEPFVLAIVGSGVALVAGLWVVGLTAPLSLPWLAGAGLALLATAGLGGGIWSEIEW